MKQVFVEKFGGPEVLEVRELPTPEPAAGLVRVKLTSIGMNHAELLGRMGQYKLSTGDPPFTPGLEAGGIIDAIGAGVTSRKVGDRVVLSPDLGRAALAGSVATGSSVGGTYRSHYLCDPRKTFLAPPSVPDVSLGALWLPYLTAWGCLAWKQKLHETDPAKRHTLFVALPAASSSVALAAAQVIRHIAPGVRTIGLTSSPAKIQSLRALESCVFDELIATRDEQGNDVNWRNDIRRITGEHGVHVFFDPVGNGSYLDTELKCLGQHGTIWVYGLLEKPGVIDISPIIRKQASIRGWVLSELIMAGAGEFEPGCRHILEGFASGVYRQHIGSTFPLEKVREAHEFMHHGGHTGKLVMVP